MGTYDETQMNETINFLKENDDFLIVSHVHPDGDTISSSLAMAFILEGLGKSYTLVNQDEAPSNVKFLPMIENIQRIAKVNRRFKYVITVDVADRHRTGNIEPLLENEATLLNIDHHPTNDFFGDINLIVSTAAATAEIMFDIAKEIKLELHKNIATCIYTGLLTDTGGFRYSNTTPKVMRIAAELLEFHISPGEIAEIALETISLSHVALLKIALTRMEVVEDGFIAWTVLSHNDLVETKNEDTEGIVNYTRNIDGVEVGIFFKEVDRSEIKVSLRSKKMIDVAAIAKGFGGGGHARAAGITFHGSLEEIKKQLIIKIKESKGWNNLGKEK